MKGVELLLVEIHICITLYTDIQIPLYLPLHTYFSHLASMESFSINTLPAISYMLDFNVMFALVVVML